MTRSIALRSLAAILLLAGCKDNPSKLDAIMKSMPVHTVRTDMADCGDKAASGDFDIDSKDILARTETSPSVQVKHVLIGWKDLEQQYRGHMDPRAAKRSQADAAAFAKEMLEKMKTDPSKIDELVAQNSEDPGAKSGEPYEVKAETSFVPEFKNLALRLKVGEAGIVKTNYGYHVMMRVPPPPPDALESVDILARTDVEKGTVNVQHVLVGWKGAPGARTATRTKAEAEAIAKEVFAKVKAGGAMPELMKQYSEDPGSKDNGRVYDVSPDAPMVEPFKNLSLRLKLDEAGIVKSPFGYHIIKRITPPPPAPPDALESADILKREPTTDKAKVKHILLGYKDLHAQDPRGIKRERADLDKLVKDTVAKLQKGAKIGPLMAELSEDPGSAKSGEAYDVTPTAGLVPPFKNLSLRLKPGEVGVVKTEYGFHIIQRIDGTPLEKDGAGAPSEPPPTGAPPSPEKPATPATPPPAP